MTQWFAEPIGLNMIGAGAGLFSLRNDISTYPVFVLDPSEPGQVAAFDITPSAGAQPVGGYMAWVDICNWPVRSAPTSPGGALFLGITPTATVIGSRVFNGHSIMPLFFQVQGENFLKAWTNKTEFVGNPVTVGAPASTSPASQNQTGFSISQDGTFQASAQNKAAGDMNRKGGAGKILNFRLNKKVVGGVRTNSKGQVTYSTFQGEHITEIVNRPLEVEFGTILETVDEVLDDFDYLAKAKISDTAASTAVYGTYAGATEDGFDTVTGLGTSFVRVQSGQNVARGDLLESAGDGTARVQGDAIIRSSTIAKVAAAVHTDTYADGSFTVPAVLYCG